MRDNSEGTTELIDLREDPAGQYFLIIAHNFDKRRFFRIGLQRDGYIAFRQIFDHAPFDKLNRKYKRFWNGSLAPSKDGVSTIGIRYDSGKEGKSFQMPVPKDLVANFVWLYDARMDYEKIKYLEIDSAQYRGSEDGE